MSTDDESIPNRSNQAAMRFDDAPERFRSGHRSDQFSGAVNREKIGKNGTKMMYETIPNGA